MRFIQDGPKLVPESESESESTLKHRLRSRSRLRWKPYRLRSPGLSSLQSATWKHLILTFDLTLTWHVTSILNFRKWFGSVTSRSFECRLVRLSTSIRFRDSTRVGSDPPPGCGGYRNSPGGGGLRLRLFTYRTYTFKTFEFFRPFFSGVTATISFPLLCSYLNDLQDHMSSIYATGDHKTACGLPKYKSMSLCLCLRHALEETIFRRDIVL